MLIQFTVGNYRSFKDPVTLSMVAANLKAKDKTLDENNSFAATPKLRLLKSAALYGANASGKSNLVKALKFMREFVVNSSRETQTGDLIPVEPFRLSAETDGLPSFFEIEFLHKNQPYRYGFEVDAERVHSEWLFYTPKSERKLFTREGDQFSLGKDFDEGKSFREITRKNALFLSVVAQFNGSLANAVLSWFFSLEVVTGAQDTRLRSRSERALSEKDSKPALLSFMEKMDLGIEDFTFDTNIPKPNISDPSPLLRNIFRIAYESPSPKGFVKTVHKKFDIGGNATATEIFDLDEHESEGTKKLFAFASLFQSAMKIGQTVVIDELDARLHPLLTLSILQLFNNNIQKAQLIFTTHDTNLLSNKTFRRDQVWFTEKDKYGSTDLYSLVEYKVRNDASYEKNYIAGKYGAIPFIGSLHLQGSFIDE